MFSGKHYAYGYKTQCLHAMNALCVRYNSEFYGSQHDFDIFNSTLPEFESLLKKGNGEYYSVMADLGYIGSRCRINYTVQEHFPNYTRGNANEPTNQLKEDNM